MTPNDDNAIELNHVYETYELEVKTETQVIRESFAALKDVTFSVKQGEALAIIGPNGAGKSTLLRILAGLLRPEKGDVKIHGRVSSLLDLGAGFHPELTGRDNLLLNASLYNFSREEMRSKLEQILQFADIGKFIDVPVRCYSQGMYVRLAFSLAIHVDPDILLIDDCLAVGDDNFRLKSLDKVLEFRTRNKTIVFVTHDFSSARQVCVRGLYLREGKILKDGGLDEAVACYVAPLSVDKRRYKYLGAKIVEEEERNRLEQEAWHNAQNEFRKQEELRRAQHIEQEILRRMEDEEQRRVDDDRRKEQRAKRKAAVELKGSNGLRVVVAPGRVQVFLHEQELTDEEGLRTLFNKGKFIDFSSSFVNWWVIKVSDTRVMCFLRWERTVRVSQVWRWSLMPDGRIDLQIDTRSLDGQPMENLRVECRLNSKRVSAGEVCLSPKSRIIPFGAQGNIAFMTTQDDQVSGSYFHGDNKETLYFLGVCDEAALLTQGVARRSYSFKGSFSSLGWDEPSFISAADVAHTLVQGEFKFVFLEGRGVLSLGHKILSAGLGFYTSLYANGVWYDSAQARWSIVSANAKKLIVKGSWPWIPVTQVWEMELISDKRINLDLRMRILRGFPMKVYETVLALDPAYGRWSVGEGRFHFPSDVTHDDFFRICLLSRDADGMNSVSLDGMEVPSLVFRPGPLSGQRIVLENAGHIAGKEARLLHCLMTYDQQDHFVKEGEYELFKGSIDIEGRTV